MEEIVKVGKRNTLGLVPNGMKVKTREGEEYRFVVWNRGNLINLIKNMPPINERNAEDTTITTR